MWEAYPAIVYPWYLLARSLVGRTEQRSVHDGCVRTEYIIARAYAGSLRSNQPSR